MRKKKLMSSMPITKTIRNPVEMKCDLLIALTTLVILF